MRVPFSCLTFISAVSTRKKWPLIREDTIFSRPFQQRARLAAEAFTDLDIGMDIMVNYNMEKHEERGWSVEENAKKAWF